VSTTSYTSPSDLALLETSPTQGLASVLKHRTAVSVAVGLLALGLRAALLPVLPIPEPAVSDEFSYLLGAETFCSGRLANPPHPLWVHFETIHENQQPTYATKYPPAQSLFLALGQKLFGHPWFGVWLSVGFMCACLSWMLQGWVTPRYALLGALIAIVQWGIVGYWINSYWGGAVGAAGGALVAGAVPRLARRATASAAALGSLGVILLANSRPYEGALTTLAAIMVLLVWRRRTGRRLTGLLAAKVVLPAVFIFTAAGAGMAYYNYRVTGDPLLMPYVVNQRQYSASPHLWILPLGAPPVYRHDSIRRLWLEWDRPLYFVARAHPATVVRSLFGSVLPYFLNPIMALPVVIAVLLRRGPKVFFVLVLAAIPAAGLLMEKSLLPHYFSPAAGLMLVLVLYGLQYLRAARVRGVRLGTSAVVVFAGLFLTYAGFGMNFEILYAPPSEFAVRRSEVSHELQAAGGRHLVIVRYTPKHSIHEEWVYNHPDIDNSAIVWARDMGTERNRELISYYQGRKVWLLQPDSTPRLAPYPSP
jgi:hypothetical protein